VKRRRFQRPFPSFKGAATPTPLGRKPHPVARICRGCSGRGDTDCTRCDATGREIVEGVELLGQASFTDVEPDQPIEELRAI